MCEPPKDLSELPKPSILNDERQELGEGPHWIDSANQLLIVDIDTNAVKFISNASKKVVETHIFDDKVGAAIPYADDPNLLVVAVGNRLIKYNRETRKELETLCDVTEHERGVVTRINDSKCDPYGRIIFGTMLKQFVDPYPDNKGKLFSYHKGQMKVLLDDVGLSNGLAWSRDKKTMYYIDSLPKRVLYAMDYTEEGNVENRRILVDFSKDLWRSSSPKPVHGRKHLEIPDGMTVDDDDKLWIALFGLNGAVRIDPKTGKFMQQVWAPSMNTTSLCFGGPNFDTLFMTSAGVHNVPKGVKEPQGGNTFAFHVPNVRGRPPVNFAG